LHSCLRQSQSFVHSAIHQDSLPGYVRRAFRREPNNGFGNFAGLAQPLKRSVGSPGGKNLFFFFAQSGGARPGQFFQAIGGGESGSDVVDQNSVFAELVGQALYKPHHGSTNGVREHQVGDGLFGGNGSNGDDTSPALTLHVGDNFAREIYRAKEICLYSLAPVVEAGSEKALGGRTAGVGHADVDSAKFSGDGSNEPANGFGIGNVKGFGENLGPMLISDLAGGKLEGLLVACADGHATALGRKCFRGSEPDSLAGSSHQSDAVFQAQIHRASIINVALDFILSVSWRAVTLSSEVMRMKRRSFQPETKAVRGASDLEKKNGPMATPIYQTSTFEVADNDEQLRVTPTDRFYTRYGNPTNTVAEQTIAQLEGVDAALTFASGMGAITTTIMALLKSGDHIVAQRDIYGGATKFFTQWLPKMGIETTIVDTTEYEQHARAIRPNTKLLYVESPTNPAVRVVDLKKIAALARQHSLLSMIDATFGTPINQRPSEFGIDLIMHSGTKYLAGHSDLICGVVAGNRDLIDKIHSTRTTLGNCMDPHASWLLIRGLKTLAVRVTRQNDNALRVAEFLSRHDKVRRVHYPFLKSHPQYAIAREQMSGGGGMISFEVEGTGDDARRLTESLRLFTLAPSLGGVESLVSIPVLTSHAMISASERQKMGVTEQMIRLSVGIENADDLIADLDHALEAVTAGQHVQVG
jgi:cystathionine gamma-synthase